MDKKRKKLKEPIPLGRIIDGVLREFHLKPDTGLTRIWDRWEGIIGKTIAENARPAAFKGKILLVHVNSSPWIHQLQFLKTGIMNNINQGLGEHLVEEIKFKIGTFHK